MMKLIEGSYASFFPKEMDAMFRNRAETFSERLGWEVVVKNGYERDSFDDANPLYLVSVDPDTEQYWGSLRLLPTTGPNMLRDVFPQLLDGDYLESATIWECSRICAVAAPGQPERNGGGGGVNHVLNELILGIGEVAVAAGLTQIAAVFDARKSSASSKPPDATLRSSESLNRSARSCATPAFSTPASVRSRRSAPRPGSTTPFSPQAPKRLRSPDALPKRYPIEHSSANQPEERRECRIRFATPK